MRRKLLIIYLLIVALPLVLLGWMGERLARDEQQAFEQRIQQLLLQRLSALDLRIVEFLGEYQRDLLRQMKLDDLNPDRLRAKIWKNPRIRQLFVLDAQGRWVHPPPQGDLSDSEKDFFTRIKQIKRDRDPLYARPIETNTLTQRQHLSFSDAPQQGWSRWYWGTGMRLILWQHSGQYTVGVETDRVRLLSELIGVLPETNLAQPLQPKGSIALLDAQNSVIYQWGGERDATALPRMERSLSAPLDAWKLQYFISDQAWQHFSGTPQPIARWAAMIALALVLLGLAFYFYREYARASREALQRVTFVNQVSHELKTPLTNIRLYAELLQGRLDDEDPKVHSHLEVILAESERLSRLLQNILNFARRQRHSLQLRCQLTDIDSLLAQVLASFRPSLAAKGIQATLVASIGREQWVDADAIAQIIGNIIANVEKYASDGQYLGITATLNHLGVSVQISDQGPGIEARYQEKIFQPFYRISNRLRDGVAGAGIGLALARDLARLHGGDLTLMDTSQGACFELRIPLRGAYNP